MSVHDDPRYLMPCGRAWLQLAGDVGSPVPKTTATVNLWPNRGMVPKGYVGEDKLQPGRTSVYADGRR